MRVTRRHALFAGLILIAEKGVGVKVLRRDTRTGSSSEALSTNRLLIISPGRIVTFSRVSTSFRTRYVLISRRVATSIICRLSTSGRGSTVSVFRVVHSVIHRRRVCGMRVVRSVIGILGLLISRLPCRGMSIAHSLHRGGRICRVFLRLLCHRFGARQRVEFCTSGLGISTPCLSEVVGSVSKAAIGSRVASLLCGRVYGLLERSSVAVKRVTSRLRFDSRDTVAGFFGVETKVAPLTCQGRN